MPSYVEIPNENILDYHNFKFYGTSSLYSFEDDVIFCDGVNITAGDYVLLGPLDGDFDQFVISIEVLSGTSTANVVRFKWVGSSSSICSLPINESISSSVAIDNDGILRLYFDSNKEFEDFSFRVWVNGGTEPKPYQKYGEVCYQEVADPVPEMPETISGLKIDISTSEIFRYSNMITNGLMPVTYVLAGFALGFALIYALKNVFGRVGL